MALSIISSNRVESLQQNLCLRLNNAPLSDPLASEIIIVPTFAVARWLNLKMAQQQGIATNFDYPLPTPWILQLAASVLDQPLEQDQLQPENSGWKIFSLFPEMIKAPGFTSLRHYLRNDDTGIKRWQLAIRIADVFDRYQRYRPRLILDWSDGVGKDWQAQLWRALIADNTQSHRVAVIQQLIDRLILGVKASLLPERISLFAHSSLPPIFIQVIHALAQQIDVTLYQHSPTDHYWADLKNKKSMSKLRLQNPSEAEYFETGNDLLASWGRQGQALQDLLLDHDKLPFCESESYQAPGHSTLLQSIQQSIFCLDDAVVIREVDPSLSIHVCHSPMRECQVLLDSLLGMLDRDPSLDAEDILVMVPDISHYAAYIEAVFRDNELSNRPGLRWNLSDTTLADESPLVLVFLQLLKLPGSRFSRSEVLSYLDNDTLRHRFDIDDKALAEIRSTLEEAQVRWGIDEAHKASLGLPTTAENTWHQAKQRIFAGYALGEIEYWDGIAPIAEVDASRAQSLGKFWLLFERLQFWREELKIPCSGNEWQIRLNRVLNEFFAETNRQGGRLQAIRDAIYDLNKAGGIIISHALLRHWMEQQLTSREFPGRLFSGGITFCGMRPMRSLPFRVICLLGMNDGVFPRRDNRLEFDYMARNWLPGDSSKGDEDRYLMLETLLCVRQSLYISYCGRSLKDNSECQPSVLVRELLDFVDSRYKPGSGSEDCFSAKLTTLHPMQAFAASNFSPYATSYNGYWCRIANLIQRRIPATQANAWAFSAPACSANEERNIEFDDLRLFLQDPIKFFFNRRLKLWLTPQREDEDEELFALESLEEWGIKQYIAIDLIQGRETSIQILQAQGRLPHGQAAYASLEAILPDLEPLLVHLQDYRGVASLTRDLDFPLDGNFRLCGRIGNYYTGKGLMHFSSGSLKGKHLLGLWLDHLALCASEQFELDDSSLLITRDCNMRFKWLGSSEAMDQLRHYSELYNQGLASPLPVFPLTSYAWCSADDSARGLKAARRAWYGNGYRNIPGDKDNAYVKLALRGNMPEPFTSEEFCTYAQALYTTPLKNVIES